MNSKPSVPMGLSQVLGVVVGVVAEVMSSPKRRECADGHFNGAAPHVLCKSRRSFWQSRSKTAK
jgi:hypothetical protein